MGDSAERCVETLVRSHPNLQECKSGDSLLNSQASAQIWYCVPRISCNFKGILNSEDTSLTPRSVTLISCKM